MKATLAQRWVAAVEAAIEMSAPAEIVAHIRTADAPDDGLRAASYEARVSTGHRADSHPERMALDERPERKTLDWWKRDDEVAVAREGLRFIDAISAINASRDAGTADCWADAITDANNIAELHSGTFIATCIDLAHDLAPYHDTIRAVQKLTELAHRWGCPHIATIQERLTHPDACLSHARIGEERDVHGNLAICKTCRDLIAEWGDPRAEHRDPHAWPTIEMLRALEDSRKVDYVKLRAEWLASHPDGNASQKSSCRVL